MSPKAIWNGAVLAESDQTEVVEGNNTFRLTRLIRVFPVKSDSHDMPVERACHSYYIEGRWAG